MSNEKEFEIELIKIRDSIISFCQKFDVTEFDVQHHTMIDRAIGADTKVIQDKIGVSATTIISEYGHYRSLEV